MRQRSKCGFAFVVTVLVCAAPRSWAADRARISIAGIRGDADGAVAAQLASALCEANECVPGARVRRGGRLDFAAVKAERVDGVVFGTVAMTRRGTRLELALLKTSLRPQRTWVLPMDRSRRITAGALAAFALELQRAVAGSTPGAPSRAAPRPAAPPVRGGPAGAPAFASSPPRRRLPDAQRSPSAVTTAPSLSPERARPADPVRTGSTPDPVARPLATRAMGPGRGLGSLDLGTQVTRRDLDFQGLGKGTAKLQRYRANAIVSPCARLEVYPLARSESWGAGLALLGSYARSVGFESEQAALPGVRHATTLAELEVGAGWRLHPMATSRASIRPRIAWRTLSFVTKAAGGVIVPGLPDARLAGPSAGLDGELPLTGRIAILGSLAYTRWTTARDLVGGSAGFFRDGSAWAAAASAGLSVGLTGPLSLRVVAEYERTSYTLRGSTTYVATGATDRHLSGLGTVRWGF